MLTGVEPGQLELRGEPQFAESSGTRKATSVEHVRCAQCRNPIRGRQSMVRHARAQMIFHADCWASLHAEVQAAYVARAHDDGVGALLDPYSRAEMAAWLPEAAIDEAIEALGDQLQQIGEDPVSVDVLDNPAGEEPVAG
jgi:hypothetical protein